MQRKKICWVTPDCFLDTDMEVVPFIECFNIHWIILFNKKDNRYSEENFKNFKKKNLTIEFLYNTSRARYPQTLLFYMKIKKIIKREMPFLIYFNVMPSNPYILPLYFWLPKDKTIFTAHDGRVTESMSFAKLIKYGFYKAYQSVKHVNMFSYYQENFFKMNFPNKQITVIPLGLKDFGKPTISKRKDCIGFVFFGTIHFEKNLELLIEAANQLIEEGVSGFKISINGVWRVNWKPEDKIRHPEFFELKLCNIPNKDIPNIFEYNHYAVYPYKNMSQSGSIKCAYNYNTPVIVSDLPGFTNEVCEGTDGFIFKSEDVNDLKRVMRECISRSSQSYLDLQEKMRNHVRKLYDKKTILSKYIKMFDEITK